MTVDNSKKMNDYRLYDTEYSEDYYKRYKFESVNFFAYRVVKALASSLKPHKILDMGCAKGYHVMHFKNLGIETYGVDISKYAINNAPDLVKPYLLNVDLNRDSLPFPDKYFDLLTMLEVIEHMSDYNHALKEAERVLKNGKFLFVTTPKPPALSDPTHIHVYNKEEWRRIFLQNGFEENRESIMLKKLVMRKFRLMLPLVIKGPKDLARAAVELNSIIKKKSQVFLLAKAS